MKNVFLTSAILLFILHWPVFALAEEGDIRWETENPPSQIESDEDKKDPAVVPEKPAPAGLEAGLPPWAPQLLGLQFNGIYQNVPGFHSPYEGDHSFSTAGGRGHNTTHIYGVYLGSRVLSTLQAYVDIEMARGSGVSKGLGLGGYVNGDVIRTGSVDLGIGPYIARAYLRYYYSLSSEGEDMERAQDQLPGKEPVSRIEMKAGRLSVADDFDLNRYANNTRMQFMNYSFINNTAYDYAGDTRGYTYGTVMSVFRPSWRLAYGIYQVGTTANGSRFDDHLLEAQGNNLELTLKPDEAGTVVRLLAYFNQGKMGNYADALTAGIVSSTTPSVLADEKPGRSKYGFGVNFEQPLADNGETGIFGRIGWNDGHNENFSFAEVDRTLSLGAQINGAHWGRNSDRIGVAYAINGISADHRRYLASGGLGFLIGDGRLNYGTERIAEAYYRIQAGRFVQISPDVQFIENPGYNRDRGPVAVYGLRLRLSI